jgi:serine/threonine-protein kinase HipA
MSDSTEDADIKAAIEAGVLDVWLDGHSSPVGRLTREAGLSVAFAYDTSNQSMRAEVPLSFALPVRLEPYQDRAARAFFDNLLPEGELRAAIAAKHRLDTGDVVGLLAVLGADAPGAVSVLPVGAPPVKSLGNLAADYRPLSEEEVEEAVRAASTGRPPGGRLRFSLAGVQSKFAVAMDDEGRFLEPARGAPTTHIVKVERTNGRERGIVTNELTCMLLLQRLGLVTAKVHQQVIADIPCLIVERYDRIRVGTGGYIARLHQEDAAQVLGIDRALKYERDAKAANLDGGLSALFGRFVAVCQPRLEARDTLLHATFTNWLLGNSDAHLKNFSILHRPRAIIGSEVWSGVTQTRLQGKPAPGIVEPYAMQTSATLPLQPELAPLYDIVCIAAYPDFSHDLAMRIGRDETWDSVEREHWEALVRLALGGRSKAAVTRAIERLKGIAEKALPALDAIIDEGIVSGTEVKLVRDVIGSRLRHLNSTMGWDILAETDAPVVRGGGWAIS